MVEIENACPRFYRPLAWAVVTAALFLLAPPSFAADENGINRDLLTPPLVNNQPVRVTVGIYVVNLAAVDEVKETFELDGYLTENWHDDRLKYSQPPGSVHFRTYRDDEVWYPRLSMMNAAEPRSKFDVTIRAQPDGQITYMERFVVILSTKFNVGRFPFDSQNLIVDLQPTLADREFIRLSADPTLLRLNRAEYVGMAQWDIRGLAQHTTLEMGWNDQPDFPSPDDDSCKASLWILHLEGICPIDIDGRGILDDLLDESGRFWQSDSCCDNYYPDSYCLCFFD